MQRVEKSIEVNVPVSTVYNQWTQFESFPEFMEGVKEVHQLDDKRVHWKAEIAGHEIEWYAEITQQFPDERIAWRSIEGAQNAGHVSFSALDESRTKVTLRLSFDPKRLAQMAAGAIGIVDHRVEGDLERFKHYIETRGQETGAWRGSIKGGSQV